MNRIRSCLLTRFVHSDRLSAPAQDFFWLYCTIPGKKLPPQKSRFWGAIPKKFLGYWGFPLKKSPQKAQNWGDFGAFSHQNRQLQPCLCRFPPSGCNVRKGVMKNGTKDIFKDCGARPRSGTCGLRRQQDPAFSQGPHHAQHLACVRRTGRLAHEPPADRVQRHGRQGEGHPAQRDQHDQQRRHRRPAAGRQGRQARRAGPAGPVLGPPRGRQRSGH